MPCIQICLTLLWNRPYLTGKILQIVRLWTSRGSSAIKSCGWTEQLQHVTIYTELQERPVGDDDRWVKPVVVMETPGEPIVSVVGGVVQGVHPLWRRAVDEMRRGWTQLYRQFKRLYNSKGAFCEKFFVYYTKNTKSSWPVFNRQFSVGPIITCSWALHCPSLM